MRLLVASLARQLSRVSTAVRIAEHEASRQWPLANVDGRTKNGREQVIPLSEQAAELFQRALELSDNAEFAFPANTGSVKIGKKPRTPHINGQSVSRAMRRLRERYDLDDVTLHDMRRCVATWLGNQAVRPGVIELILNHTKTDVTGRHYMFAKMSDAVRQALQSWADHVDGLVLGRVADGKVVPFQRT